MRAERGGRTVEVSQRVVGTPEEVFPYFTEPEKYRLWQGREAELDPRPGGVFRVNFLPGYDAQGDYLVVDPPHRVVFSWGWKGSSLPPSVADVPPGFSTVEITLVPDGNETIITLRHRGLPSDAAGGFHEWGWKTLYLPRLDLVRAGRDPGPEPAPTTAGEYTRTGRLPPG